MQTSNIIIQVFENIDKTKDISYTSNFLIFTSEALNMVQVFV